MSRTTRLAVAVLIFMMLQAVVFFAGILLVLATPLASQAMILMPWVVAVSLVISLPVSWFMAPMLRARYLHAREGRTSRVWAD